MWAGWLGETKRNKSHVRRVLLIWHLENSFVVSSVTSSHSLRCKMKKHSGGSGWLLGRDFSDFLASSYGPACSGRKEDKRRVKHFNSEIRLFPPSGDHPALARRGTFGPPRVEMEFLLLVGFSFLHFLLFFLFVLSCLHKKWDQGRVWWGWPQKGETRPIHIHI